VGGACTISEIPPSVLCDPHHVPLSGTGTLSARQFDWGGRLQKSNAGAQRLA